ncbi:hypothetical protein HYC85_030802 [Camellia sinensis]|uniref:Uncharacterized protein n=1 Tax=Camellia sinensis TaxID=4442 RepID=A0A7J7G3N6_CAMSI|nr:hypothetical protein HYC85_030802 [Camellia sinensis]
MCSFRSFRVAAVSPASGLPNPFLCLVSVCEPDSVFSVSFLEGRERSRRPSLNVRRLHFVAVGHFAHFGVRFPVVGAVRPCASVRDRLIISVCPSFWHTSYLLPFEEHWGTSVLSPGRSLKGGRLVIVASASYLSSGASRRPFFQLPGQC